MFLVGWAGKLPISRSSTSRFTLKACQS
jgi:hypothetical protein